MDGAGSPENTPATVRGFPGSALIFCGRALIFGGVPVNKENNKVSEGFPRGMIRMIYDYMIVTLISHNVQADGLKAFAPYLNEFAEALFPLHGTARLQWKMQLWNRYINFALSRCQH